MEPFCAGPIVDVIWKPLQKFSDAHGWLCELFRQDDLPAEFQPAMAYLSETQPGVMRGPHEHRDQTDCFYFLGPSTFRIDMWDNRPKSPTFWRHETALAGVDQPMMILVPPGIVHAYRNIGTVPGLIVNAPNRLYRGPGKHEPIDEIRHENDPHTPFRVAVPNGALRYRRYQPADQAACLAILNSNLERYFSPGDVEEFLHFLNAPSGFYGVVEQSDGRIVGCGGAGVRDGVGILTWGMVHADSHGQGLGRFLFVERLRTLLDHAGVQSVRINTSHETLGFYLKMGFVVTRHQRDGYRPGLDRYDLELPWNDEVKRRLL